MGKNNNTTATTNTSTRADPQADAAYRAILERAGNVANTPYQAYSGELTAPVGLDMRAGSSTGGAVGMRSAVTRVGVRTQISLAATVFSLNPEFPGATRYPSPPIIGA